MMASLEGFARLHSRAGRTAEMSYRFDADVWISSGEGGWHFLTLPVEVAEEIQAETVGRTRGFGSVRVLATIGVSTWSTSLFPDRKASSFVLPLKKAVRVAEDFEFGDRVEVTLALDLSAA